MDINSFLLELKNTLNEEEREWLLMRFSLNNLPERLQKAVWAAVIPHWFDKDFLDSLMDDALTEEEFKSLTRLPYVEFATNNRYRIKKPTYNILIKKHNKKNIKKFSQRAANYCLLHDQEINSWYIESIYHMIVARLADEAYFVETFNTMFNNHQYETLDILLTIILDSINLGVIKGEIVGWIYMQRGKLESFYNNYLEAMQLLNNAKSYVITIKSNKSKHLLKDECIFTVEKILDEIGEKIIKLNHPPPYIHQEWENFSLLLIKISEWADTKKVHLFLLNLLNINYFQYEKKIDILSDIVINMIKSNSEDIGIIFDRTWHLFLYLKDSNCDFMPNFIKSLMAIAPRLMEQRHHLESRPPQMTLRGLTVPPIDNHCWLLVELLMYGVTVEATIQLKQSEVDLAIEGNQQLASDIFLIPPIKNVNIYKDSVNQPNFHLTSSLK